MKRGLLLIPFLSLSLFASVTLSKLESEIIKRLDKVEEFSDIKKLADELKIKEVYLFGGTASAWGHYVYNSLEHEEGNLRYTSEIFDYDFSSIFRLNQDVDIVIKGDENQARLLEEKLAELFPYSEGPKSIFEVRLLDKKRKDKEPLIDENFLKQNNDSHSTGLIEIVGNNKERIQDLRDPHKKEPRFLKDLFSRKLHYYYDPKAHATTNRFIEGKNPEIISVIRYLTKLFQYDLAMDDESKTIITKIINDFNPRSLQGNQYLLGWLEHNGPKLFQNAVDVEFAWNTLEELHLRKKLMAINANPEMKGSLAWWMNKEPLHSFDVGKGTGSTAKELGLSLVSHETTTFEIYESIMKTYSGKPNVFVSRPGASSEVAIHGKGFYTRIGSKGAKGTGITARFTLLPNAREFSDFDIYDDFILVKNRAAVKTVYETSNITLLDLFSSSAENRSLFDMSNKAIEMRLKRKLHRQAHKISPADELKIVNLVKKNLNSSNSKLFEEWFAMPFAEKYPEIAEELLAQNSDLVDRYILIPHFFTKPFSFHNPNWLETLVKRQNLKTVSPMFSSPVWAHHKEKLIQLMNTLPWPSNQNKTDYLDDLAKSLSANHWKESPELVHLLIKKGIASWAISKYFVESPNWADHPEFAEYLLTTSSPYAKRTLSDALSKSPHWSHRSDWFITLISSAKSDHFIREKLLNSLKKGFYTTEMQVLLKFLEANLDDEDEVINTQVLTLPAWSENQELKALLAGRPLSTFSLREIIKEQQPHKRRRVVKDCPAMMADFF